MSMVYSNANIFGQNKKNRNFKENFELKRVL